MDVPAYELLRENLRRLTEERGVSLSELADRAWIPRTELFEAMTGEYDPDLEWLIRLAKALGVQLSELFDERTLVMRTVH